MSRSSRHAFFLLAILAALVAWTSNRLSAAMTWRYPPVNELVVTEHYLTDIGALLLGAHRLAADIAYVQLLQYYGVREGHSAHGHDHDHEDDGHPSRPHPFRHDYAGGNYPRLKELSTRILRLDPYFNQVILEAAGALAFNQKRTDEALAYLREAIQRDPTFYRYHLYVGAILYKSEGKDAELIDLLLEAIKFPDCPPLFELVLGNLLKKVGRPLEAMRVYYHTHTTTADKYYRNDALGRIKRLAAERPDIARQFEAELPR